MDSYSAMLKRLFSKHTHKKTTDLAISTMLSHIFSHPHTHYPTIHVAGTNGKGSVVTKIAAALQEAGWKTGLYTSPHVFDFEERISINGKNIPKEKILEKEQIIEKAFRHLPFEPNFFEITTCFALSYFSEEKVDVAVVETGLGGRLDATNIISPILSIITSISLDHTEILGNSLEEIAKEKAGIIKRNTPVVLGPRAQLPIILDMAKSLSSPVYLVEKSGIYIEENCAIARRALQLLKNRFALWEKAIEIGLKKSPPCRLEKKGNIIFDVAHNPDGFAALIATLKHLYYQNTFRFVIGLSKDKEIKKCLAIMAQVASYVHFVQAKILIKSTCSPEELGKEFSSLAACKYSVEPSIEQGIENALIARNAEEFIVICGSFYIMQQAVSYVSNKG